MVSRACDRASGKEGGAEELVKDYQQGATMTDASAYFEEALESYQRDYRVNGLRFTVKLKTAHEWEMALRDLEVAMQSCALPPRKPGPASGTFSAADIRGRRVGRATRMDGKDMRGRHDHNPLFEGLVYSLLDRTNGELTFDKNGPSGSLIDLLKELRPELPPKVIPRMLPASTINRWVVAWRRRQPNRTKKAAIVVVK